jgi:hypothetical protein
LSRCQNPSSDVYEVLGTYEPNLVVITRKGLSLDRPSGIEESFADFVLGTRDFAEMTLFCKSSPVSSFLHTQFSTYPSISRTLLKFARLRSASTFLVSEEWPDMVGRIFAKHVALGPSFMPLDVWEELRDLSSESLLRLPSTRRQSLCKCIMGQEIVEMMEFVLTLHSGHNSERGWSLSSATTMPIFQSNLWDYHFNAVSDLLSSIWGLYVLLLNSICLLMTKESEAGGQNAKAIPIGLVANFMQHLRHFWVLLKLTDKTLLSTQSNSFFDPSITSPQRGPMETETDTALVLANSSIHPAGGVSFRFPLETLLVQQTLSQMSLSTLERSSFLISPYSILSGLLREFHKEDGEAEFLVQTALPVYRQGDAYQTHQILSYASFRSAGVSHLLCKANIRLGRMDQAVENGLLAIRFFGMLIIFLPCIRDHHGFFLRDHKYSFGYSFFPLDPSQPLSASILSDFLVFDQRENSSLTSRDDYVGMIFEIFEREEAVDGLIQMIPRILCSCSDLVSYYPNSFSLCTHLTVIGWVFRASDYRHF